MITVNYNKLNIKPGYKILDMGCGSGRHTCGVYQLKNITAIGVDLDLNDLKEAAQKLAYHDSIKAHGGGNWALSVADIRQIPFQNESFDLVICSEVLEHIIDDKAAISELERVLKPNCNLVVSVPRYWPERICWALSDSYVNADKGGHVRIYNRQNLIKLIKKQTDLKFILYHHAHSIHSPFWWLKCLIGPSKKDSALINIYHKLLVWDLMEKPWITQFIDKLFNPIAGKSVVLYFKKT